MPHKKISSGFAKHVALLASGTIVAQVITIVASPMLTRLYTPDAFGALAAFGAFWAIIGTISTLNYNIAIPLAEDDTKAVRVFLIASGSLVGTTIAIAFVVLFFGDHLAALIGGPDIGDYLWLLPAGLLLSESVALCSYWAIRKKAFARVSWAEGGQGAASVITQTIMGLLSLGTLGLVLGKMTGILFAYVTYLRSTVREIRLTGTRSSLKEIGSTAKEFYQYPAYRMPAMAVNMLSRQLPFLAIPVLFGLGPTGMYALTYRVLQTPMALIGGNIQRVFLSRAIEAKRAGTLPETTSLLFRSLVLISLPTFALFGLVAPEAFAFVFGEPWRQSGVYAQWMLPMIFLVFVCAPLTALPMVFDRQREEMIFQAILLCGRGAAILIGMSLDSADVIVGMLGIVGTAAWSWYISWGVSLIGQRATSIAASILREAVYAMPFLLPVALVQVLEWPSAIPNRTLVAALASMAVLLPLVALRLNRLLRRS